MHHDYFAKGNMIPPERQRPGCMSHLLARPDNSVPERVLKSTWYTHMVHSGQLGGN